MTKNLPALIPDQAPAKTQSTAVALVPTTSTAVADPATATNDPVPYAFNEGTNSEDAPALEAPPKKAPPPPHYMTLEAARRLINRVRRTDFYLYVRVGTYDAADWDQFTRPAYSYVPVTAQMLFDIIERTKGDVKNMDKYGGKAPRAETCLVRCEYREAGSHFDRNTLFFGA